MRFLCWTTCAVTLSVMLPADARSQSRKGDPPAGADEERASLGQSLTFTEQLLTRKLDEQTLVQALSEIAQVDRVRYTGPPPRVVKNRPSPPGSTPSIACAGW
jgi:hypothetical protein